MKKGKKKGRGKKSTPATSRSGKSGTDSAEQPVHQAASAGPETKPQDVSPTANSKAAVAPQSRVVEQEVPARTSMQDPMEALEAGMEKLSLPAGKPLSNGSEPESESHTEITLPKYTYQSVAEGLPKKDEEHIAILGFGHPDTHTLIITRWRNRAPLRAHPFFDGLPPPLSDAFKVTGDQVAIKSRLGKGKYLVAKKAFAAGDVILYELPLLAIEHTNETLWAVLANFSEMLAQHRPAAVAAFRALHNCTRPGTRSVEGRGPVITDDVGRMQTNAFGSDFLLPGANGDETEQMSSTSASSYSPYECIEKAKALTAIIFGSIAMQRSLCRALDSQPSYQGRRGDNGGVHLHGATPTSSSEGVKEEIRV